ncbi:MAG: pyridoxamine 5'-phosphate oxidase family protein [Alphaproteobacteria bacterium]|nr:pyridoxamine 5'-phosphate oxidase family protein [Alphaproteobacteria bacterium]
MNKAEILNFIDAQAILILTTMNGMQPETRALINIRNAGIAPHLAPYFKNNDRILFITNTHTDKIKQIRANHRGALYAYSNSFSGLLLTGKITEVTDAETIDALWDDSWKMYYPDGKNGGDFSVLEFVPENFKSYSGEDFSKQAGAVE